MSTCANCSAELQPEWRFCVFCGTPAIPGAIRPEQTARPGMNALAVLALVLACVGGFPALIFGHIAMAQIRTTGERGMLIARIATVLGYIWLAVLAAVVIGALNGAF